MSGSADRWDEIQREITDLVRLLPAASPQETGTIHNRIIDLEREARQHEAAATARSQHQIDAWHEARAAYTTTVGTFRL